MNIEYLPRNQDIIHTLAKWHYAQWGYLNPGDSVETRIADFNAQLGSKGIPITFIALSEATLLGSASLVAHDMDTRPDLSPWLASVYVAPEYRNRGVGSALVRRAMEEARDRGVGRLYLFTPNKEAFYTHLGWSTVERTDYKGEPVVIMAYTF